MHDLGAILSKFEEIVSPNFCNNLARETHFVQRSTSKIMGYEFAQAMMIPNAFLKAETLNSIASRMERINSKCNLSAPALTQRINTKSAETFMKACFGKVLKEITKKEFSGLSDLQILSEFNRVLIQDTTQIELHENLSPYFKGSGGASSKSSVKIDYIFDYLTENVIDIEFFPGNIPDQKIAKRLTPILKKDDLVIRDLGYCVLDSLKEIEKQEAYYISRFQSNVLVFKNQESTQPLDLAKFLDQNIVRDMVDITVYIGEEKYPTRLVACLMSEDAINKRLRAANRSAQRTRTQTSKRKLSLLRYCIFITNVSATILSSIEIMATYRARWRIELIFKQWKSCLNLHFFKGHNKERFHCFMYGRLIMILLLGAISPPLMKYAFTFGRELSCYKLTNYLIADHVFARAINEGRIEQFVSKLIADIPRRLCMDKRKRLSLRCNVRMGNSYYNELEMTDKFLKIA